MGSAGGGERANGGRAAGGAAQGGGGHGGGTGAGAGAAAAMWPCGGRRQRRLGGFGLLVFVLWLLLRR